MSELDLKTLARMSDKEPNLDLVSLILLIGAIAVTAAMVVGLRFLG